MAKKKKSRIKDVVETVESWVGMGPKAKKATTAPAPQVKTAKKTKKKAAAPKKGKKAVKKKKK